MKNNIVFGIRFIFLASMLSLLSACGDPVDTTPITISMPFKNYTVDSDSMVLDSGSGIVHASIGPFGAHFSPLTGHIWGDGKGNLIGYMARTDAELTFFTDVAGNGICEPLVDACGLDGGAGGSTLLAMQPIYIAPLDATVSWVSQDVAPGVDAMYFNSQPHWRVDLKLTDRYTLRIGHLGSIATALHDKILTATGIDTNAYTAGDGVNLVNGVSISLAQGEEVAHPQLVANEVAGHPGFYNGGGGDDKYPWSQMEFKLIDSTVDGDACVYDILSPTEKTSLSNAMIADMQSPLSARYGGVQQANIWKWGAEAILCPVYATGSFTDFSDIHSKLGGWSERASAGVVRDEIFAIVEIQTGTAMYSATNYDSGVTHLVTREISSPTPAFNWVMPDTSTPGDIYYPAGEVLEETANTLLIKWRDFSNIYTSPIYQRAAFELDANGLKIKWGDFAATAVAAVQPVLSGDICNDTNVICYDHSQSFR